MFRTTLAAAVLAASPVLAETWDMPTPYPDANFHTRNIQQFADELKAATDGGIEITVHSAGSLYPHPEIKNAVRSRQVALGEILLSTLSNEDAAYGIDSQPFLATSYDDAMKLWQAQKPVITDLLAKQDLVPLFSVAWPAQGLYSNGEIKTVADLNGLRFRVYNAALEEFASLAGAAPVQVEAADLAQAFTTGQVEAMLTSPSTGANSKAWDFVSHYAPINAWVPKNIVFINKKVFDALDEDTRTKLLAAADAAEKRGWEMSKEESDTQTQALKDNGMTIYDPSPELVSGLKEIGAKMLENWKSSASPEATAILDAYMK